MDNYTHIHTGSIDTSGIIELKQEIIDTIAELRKMNREKAKK